MKEEYIDLVYRVVSGNPIEVFDEEKQSVWNCTLWELSAPRDFGTYKDVRKIGSANLITAYNLLTIKLYSSELNALDVFKQCLAELERRERIRKIPETVRKTFKVV